MQAYISESLGITSEMLHTQFCIYCGLQDTNSLQTTILQEDNLHSIHLFCKIRYVNIFAHDQKASVILF